jgi:hypothetical protein
MRSRWRARRAASALGDARERDHPPSRGFGETGGTDQQIDVREQARQQDIELFLRLKCSRRRLAAHLERQKLSHILWTKSYITIS